MSWENHLKIQENKLPGKLIPWIIIVYGEMSDGRKKWENKVPGGKNSGDKCGAARVSIREYFYSVIFEISDKQMQFAELKNTPKQKKTDALITLINQSQEIRPQGLDLGRSTASNQAIANLRPQPRS